MLGVIAGDVIGSVYENKKAWQSLKSPDFEPLFHARARPTDDTVLTVAVAQWLLTGADLAGLLKEYAGRYPGAGFGGEFKRWAASDSAAPYGSWGNGSAMRVSPVAYAFDTLAEVLHAAKESARVTHDHPEGIKGAQATAAAIYLARTGADKPAIRDEVERRFGYDLGFTAEEIRPSFGFDSSCQGTVPPALVAFLDSTGYESAVRLAVSLGGDADTLSCIDGGIAPAFYGGVPGPIRAGALLRLDDELRGVVAAFEARFPAAAERGESPGTVPPGL